MSLEQKIPDGVIVIPRTHPLSWIMMFYALPKEMFENLPEYRQLPRNMRNIQVSEKYMRMINCDDFLIMIWSLYAWMVWHCLRVPGKNGEYRPISGAWGHYSEDFPIWRMTYEIGMHFRDLFERCSNWTVQRLFDLKKDEEMPWLSLPDFCTIVKSMTQFVIDNMNLEDDSIPGNDTKLRLFILGFNSGVHLLQDLHSHTSFDEQGNPFPVAIYSSQNDLPV